jgi:hypothetical protein
MGLFDLFRRPAYIGDLADDSWDDVPPASAASLVIDAESRTPWIDDEEDDWDGVIARAKASHDGR